MSDTTLHRKPTEPLYRFHGINFEDLRSLSTLKRQNNSCRRQESLGVSDRKRTVIFEAGGLLDDSRIAESRRWLLLLDGKSASSRVLVLEADPYRRLSAEVQVVDFDWIENVARRVHRTT